MIIEDVSTSRECTSSPASVDGQQDRTRNRRNRCGQTSRSCGFTPVGIPHQLRFSGKQKPNACRVGRLITSHIQLCNSASHVSPCSSLSVLLLAIIVSCCKSCFKILYTVISYRDFGIKLPECYTFCLKSECVCNPIIRSFQRHVRTFQMVNNQAQEGRGRCQARPALHQARPRNHRRRANRDCLIPTPTPASASPIQKARSESMPKDNIDRAIARAAGADNRPTSTKRSTTKAMALAAPPS